MVAGKWVALIAVLFSLLVAGAAEASIPTTKHDTTIRVHRVFVTANGRVSVGGILKSDSRACKGGRDVQLMRKRKGNDEFLDAGLGSFPHGAWAARSAPGTADGSKFYVRASPEVITSVTIGGRHEHRRRFVCRADRVPLELPPATTAAIGDSP